MPFPSFNPDPSGEVHRLPADDEDGTGGGGTGSSDPQVFTGHYSGSTPTDTPTASAAIAYDLDSPHDVWYWNGSGWF